MPVGRAPSAPQGGRMREHFLQQPLALQAPASATADKLNGEGLREALHICALVLAGLHLVQ